MFGERRRIRWPSGGRRLAATGGSETSPIVPCARFRTVYAFKCKYTRRGVVYTIPSLALGGGEQRACATDAKCAQYRVLLLLLHEMTRCFLAKGGGLRT